MKRRSFLKFLGMGAAAPAVAKAVEQIPESPAYFGTAHQEGVGDFGSTESYDWGRSFVVPDISCVPDAISYKQIKTKIFTK